MLQSFKRDASYAFSSVGGNIITKIPQGKLIQAYYKFAKSKDGSKGTGKYNTDTMKHIYHGEVNKRGRAVGYHHESMMGGKIIPGTETKPDTNGVYRAKVEIDGVKKKATSSFFPKEWDRVQVLKAIDEAFNT